MDGPHRRMLRRQAEHLRLVRRHGRPQPGHQARDRPGPAGRTRRRRHAVGQRPRQPRGEPVRLVRGLLPAARARGLARCGDGTDGLGAAHTSSSFATWIVRISEARTARAAAAHSVHPSHPKRRPAATSSVPGPARHGALLHVVRRATHPARARRRTGSSPRARRGRRPPRPASGSAPPTRSSPGSARRTRGRRSGRAAATARRRSTRRTARPRCRPRRRAPRPVRGPRAVVEDQPRRGPDQCRAAGQQHPRGDRAGGGGQPPSVRRHGNRASLALD